MWTEYLREHEVVFRERPRGCFDIGRHIAPNRTHPILLKCPLLVRVIFNAIPEFRYFASKSPIRLLELSVLPPDELSYLNEVPGPSDHLLPIIGELNWSGTIPSGLDHVGMGSGQIQPTLSNSPTVFSFPNSVVNLTYREVNIVLHNRDVRNCGPRTSTVIFRRFSTTYWLVNRISTS
jgi:hypothetical protein